MPCDRIDPFKNGIVQYCLDPRFLVFKRDLKSFCVCRISPCRGEALYPFFSVIYPVGLEGQGVCVISGLSLDTHCRFPEITDPVSRVFKRETIVKAQPVALVFFRCKRGLKNAHEVGYVIVRDMLSEIGMSQEPFFVNYPHYVRNVSHIYLKTFKVFQISYVGHALLLIISFPSIRWMPLLVSILLSFLIAFRTADSAIASMFTA